MLNASNDVYVDIRPAIQDTTAHSTLIPDSSRRRSKSLAQCRSVFYHKYRPLQAKHKNMHYIPKAKTKKQKRTTTNRAEAPSPKSSEPAPADASPEGGAGRSCPPSARAWPTARVSGLPARRRPPRLPAWPSLAPSSGSDSRPSGLGEVQVRCRFMRRVLVACCIRGCSRCCHCPVTNMGFLSSGLYLLKYPRGY